MASTGDIAFAAVVVGVVDGDGEAAGENALAGVLRVNGWRGDDASCTGVRCNPMPLGMALRLARVRGVAPYI